MPFDFVFLRFVDFDFGFLVEISIGHVI